MGQVWSKRGPRAEAVGADISPLAEFVTRVKCTIFSEAELDTLRIWTKRLPGAVDIHATSVAFSKYAELGYYKHLHHPSRWRLRKGIEQALASAIRLGKPRLEAFGRCAVLRSAQLALDGTRHVTSMDDFRDFLGETATQMVNGARELRAAVKENGRNRVTVIHRSAAGLEDDERVAAMRAPSLVLDFTSLPGSARAVPPLAGGRPKGSATAIHDCQ